MTVKDLNKKVGKNIRLYRDLREISQKEFAYMLDVSDSIVTNWENGNKFPRADNLLMISTVLEIEVWELFYTGKFVLTGDEKFKYT